MPRRDRVRGNPAERDARVFRPWRRRAGRRARRDEARRTHSLQPFRRPGIQGPSDRRDRPRTGVRDRVAIARRGGAAAGSGRAVGPRGERRRLARHRGGRCRDHDPGGAAGGADESSPPARRRRSELSRSAGGLGRRPPPLRLSPPMGRWRRGLPAACAALGLAARRPRRAGDDQQCRISRRVLFAIWRAGLVAVPANAKLHAREIAFMAADCSARNSASRRRISPRRSRANRSAPRSGSSRSASDDWRRSRRRRAGPDRRARAARISPGSSTPAARRDGPKGAMLSHRNLMTMAVLYLADVDLLTPEDTHFHLAAQSHATGLFGLSAYRQGDASGAAAERRLLAGANSRICCGLIASATFFVPPTGLRRLLRDPAFAARETREHPHGAARRRAGLRRGPEGGLRGARAATLERLRPGRKPLHDHGDAEAAARRRDRRRATRRAWFQRRPRPHRHRGRRFSTARTARSPPRRGRRSRRARRHGDGGILEPAGGVRRPRFAAAGSIPAISARSTAGLPHAARSRQGSRHFRRIEHLSARDRGRAARTPLGRRSRGDRRARSGMGRKRDGA